VSLKLPSRTTAAKRTMSAGETMTVKDSLTKSRPRP
jgi:hypothetical protein